MALTGRRMVDGERGAFIAIPAHAIALVEKGDEGKAKVQLVTGEWIQTDQKYDTAIRGL